MCGVGCVCVRVRAGACVYVPEMCGYVSVIFVCACVRVCVRACVSVCACVSVSVYVCVKYVSMRASVNFRCACVGKFCGMCVWVRA